uniref:cilia- and flagella-associated protein HOATZ n=1 Tax=Scatophagus argus TaxID=75038 RepID=UPI001ED840CD|nr:cilia- and flagella-associated protein HOATZ [Scatophagus argus]
MVTILNTANRKMSAQASCPEQEDFEDFFTVFDGSSPEDASHARQLWSSLALLPPLESRLVSAEIRQRLPVSRPAPGPKQSSPEPPSVPAVRQRQAERRRYEAMAAKRREILALLRSQREQRIQKELLSVAFKPRAKFGREKTLKLHKPSDSEEDEELVLQLP